MQIWRLLLFGHKWVSQNVALLWQSAVTTAEKCTFYHCAEKQAGGDLDVIDMGEYLDENDSGVEDASDMDSDFEKCQIESLIKKYS